MPDAVIWINVTIAAIRLKFASLTDVGQHSVERRVLEVLGHGKRSLRPLERSQVRDKTSNLRVVISTPH